MYLIFLAGSLITLFYVFRKKDLFAGILMLVFILFSFRTARFSIDFILVSSIFLAISLSYFIQNINNKSTKDFFASSPVPKFILIAVLVFCIVSLPDSKFYSIINF